MQLKTRQIIVIPNLDRSRRAGIYSNHIHVAWITFLVFGQTSQVFSHLRCIKLFGEVMSSYAAFNGELHADD